MKNILIIVLYLILVQTSCSQNLNVEERAALLNINGFNITNTTGMNPRLFQKYKIENLNINPETIILGSSRIRNISESILHKAELVNNGISSGTLKDIISFYYIYRINGFKPQEIYIGIDPWFFYESGRLNNKPEEYLEEEYGNMLEMINKKQRFNKSSISGNTKNPNFHIEEIYKPEIYKFEKEYFANTSLSDSIFNALSIDFESITLTKSNIVECLNTLIEIPLLYDKLSQKEAVSRNKTIQCLVFETRDYRNLNFEKLASYQKNNIMKLNRLILDLTYSLPSSNIDTDFPTLKNYSITQTYLKSGATTFDYRHEHRSKEEADIFAKSGALKINSEHASVKKLETKFFEQFIDYVLSENIKVNFIIIPFHPIVYNSIGKEFLDKCENYSTNFAKSRKIKVYGSFNPKVIGIAKSDFYDDSHVRITSLYKLGF